MHPEKMTGLELLQAAIDGKFPRPPMSDTMPMEITEAKAGYILGTARADERHINVMGGIHGGFAATILDSATGCAVHSMLEATSAARPAARKNCRVRFNMVSRGAK